MTPAENVVRTGLHYIDGRWRPASSGATVAVENPATEEIIGHVADGTEDDADAAVRAARAAFDEGPWGRTTPAERKAVLQRFCDILERRFDELVDLDIAECGSARSFAVPMQVGGAIAHLRETIAAMDRFAWEHPTATHVGNGVGQGLVVREPFGVALLISAYNFPLWLNLTKLAPALAAGCTVVLKPATPTPFEGLVLAEIGEEAGLPPGVLNVVTGGRRVSRALTEHPGVDIVSFTGSDEVGAQVYRQASAGLKKVVLELGGKSAHIVLDDADLDPVVASVVANTTKQAGQGCSLLTRTLVHASRKDDLVARVKDALEQVRVGDPEDPATDMGPLISAAQRGKVEELIASAVEQGATLVTGGGRPVDLERGYYLEPTLFSEVRNDMRIAQEEVFGPVNVIISFETDDEAVAIANDSPYGLSGAISSRDSARAFALARRLRTGAVIVNGGGGKVPNTTVPFGGYKASGLGREYGAWGIDEYLETKAISWGMSRG